MKAAELRALAQRAADAVAADPEGVSDRVVDDVCAELGMRCVHLGAARLLVAALDDAREEGRREARDIAQRKLDEIVTGLDWCSWGDDEAWQIQCHMDSLVDIINGAGGSVERVRFAPFGEPDSGTEAARPTTTQTPDTTETP